MFQDRTPASIRRLDPMANLRNWREIPLQAFHSRLDEWVTFEGQAAFIGAIRRRYHDLSRIEFIVYDETGAPFEHAGFGKHAADAKEKQRDFYSRHLRGGQA
jgi:fermentation-respiration switch protein FrsA (DUF1100 family)